MDIIRRNQKSAIKRPNFELFAGKSVEPSMPQQPPSDRPRFKWRIPVAIVTMIAVIAAGLFVFLPQAHITVKARTEPLTRDFEIKLDQSAQVASSADLVIPGKIIEREVAGQNKYTATGTKNVGKTASGFVTIYNFSKTTLILKKDTTELTANGRKYYFTQDVGGIRPTARIGQPGEDEIDETSLIPPVPVVGAGPGDEYNLPANARIEIKNEAFGAQPQTLYATVSEGISGGTTKQVKIVTAGDIESGYQALSRELLDRARADLAAANPGAKILDNAVTVQVLDQKADPAAGAEAQQFSVNARVKIKALTYDEDEIREIIFLRIKRLLPPEKILSDDTANFDVKMNAVNLDQGQAALQVHFEGDIVYELDKAGLLEKVRGKSAEEIREIFLSKPEIESLEVQFSPFWVKNAPSLRGKIRIDTAG
ncbi:MAG: hypothetical protein A3A83_00995 [Candidatus Doudnabacteria bacterium RIFCSPLOWO2_01_FULL_48_57]|uniref:Baseplate protein J-like domain-containing protein n=1 Tax=Candidatus Doudnabacteria bacterium RIFCSPLOWO2_02_FULL_48_13 TaxID=1817845 RepID=A0A1F5Q9U2_9BACT|nr:MAG: hypothetical protein A3K05_04135 [Candidatus Doudnabacteria bacterium RIFCSPHIGHO2_01_48_18]OGE97159.1 MAG: hypothetical protein A3A83_00995 [Candidatus Doudnabacteria bacterium RIFCSPLOWO2_01_FULL_48_57]OGE98672.1 MAG: hypothetical protein A3J05_04380 [Candidatus Doudnabacteria bacterium RIFCSPLOWO2_02_FULL_48_13]OGF00352.1 MAG: hypothetical protein A3G07_00390 [Candidatus Doudnabacteria bacterium RIFCSPLOWO2_12_FULL_47_12]